MPRSLIALLGNDQQLKDQIFFEYSGINNQNGFIPLPYSYSVLSNVIRDSSHQYQILNTPSTNNKEELISMWYNLIQISKLENLDSVTIIYCFMDSYNDINALLIDLHKQIKASNQIEFILLTSSNNQFDQDRKIANNNTFQCVQISLANLQALQQQIQKKKFIKFQNLRLQMQNENELKEIADQICNQSFSEWKEIITKSINQVDFIKIFLQKQYISFVLEKLQHKSYSKVQIFNLVVFIRRNFQERKNQFIYSQTYKQLNYSQFNYCKNSNCLLLYYTNSSNKLEKLYQTEIMLDRPSTSNKYCLACNNKIFFISYSDIIDNCFQEIQFEIIKEINENYQQDSEETLQNILQIMFLSNEEEEKTQIFNIIQQNYSTDKPRQRNQFVQSSIINDKFRFHNPPLFDFERNSENTITTFRDYFCNNAIHFFFIFVKFERTDIMIKRITNIIKKIYHLDRKRMALIVNQCLCGQEQKIELETRLAYFGFKTIHFISNDSPSDICNTLFQTLENIDTQRFDFNNTIFEQENDSSQQQQLKENLINMSRQIEEEQKNNFKRQLASDKEYLEQLEMEIKTLEETLFQKKAQQRELSYRYKQDQQKLYDWEKQNKKYKG